MVKVFFQSLILFFLIVHQHINAGWTKCVVSYRSCEVWISRIMTSSICSLLAYSGYFIHIDPHCADSQAELSLLEKSRHGQQ